MTRRRFKHIARKAIDGLPEEFQPYVKDVIVTIQSRPSKKLRQAMQMEDDEELLGLYEGPDLSDRSAGDSGTLPSRVILFYEPLLDVCETEAELIEEIQKTVLHELGHHFGMDEDDLEELGY